jgi:hypothetical protein
MLSFSAKARRATIEAFRVAGLVPERAEDWVHVRDFVAWRERLQNLDLHWGALSGELGAPETMIASARDLE